ncbi:hypothetical protein A9Q99_20140 [Gammaproteobacteria bacterium 45_16_T64]|nr:hypothetical protein A9Q99_20140 [Gammaproteobacteria bacterium 45_16_T64]
MNRMFSRFGLAVNVNKPALIILLWCAVWAGVYYEGIASAVSVWVTHDAFNHCLFVLPIALYFAYERRYSVMMVEPKFTPVFLIPMFALQGLWLVGFAADISLFQHAAIFIMIPCAISMCFGWKVVRVLWFSLCFVVFAIPVGEQLVPAFQVITADLSVLFLRWSGVPVYHDGLFITIPEGVFEVAEACSGIRFFIACVVMGSIIAYVNYQSAYKRIAFLLFSIFLPIIANGLRAYGTILVGHLIDLKYASAADHLIYGWGFFAFIIMLLVLFSRIGAEPVSPLSKPVHDKTHPAWLNMKVVPIVSIMCLPVILAFVVSLGAARGALPVSLKADVTVGAEVELVSFNGSWRPSFISPEQEYFAHGSKEEDYYVAVYDGGLDTEMVSDENRLYDIKKWRYIGQDTREVAYGQESVVVALLKLGASNGAKRLVMYWYYVPNLSSSNVVSIKLMQALNVLQGKGGVGAVIAISKPYMLDSSEVEPELLALVSEKAGRLEGMVDFSTGQ